MTNPEIPNSATYGSNLEPTPEQEVEPTRYKFVYWEHNLDSPDNLRAAAAALYDCDVVAIENVGGPSQAERVELTHNLNIINSPRTSPEEKSEARNRVIASKDSPLLAMVESITHEGQEICLIDIDQGHEAYGDTQEFINSGIVLDRAVLDLQPNAELRQLLNTNIVAGAAMARGRNPVLAEQIQAIGDDHPGSLVGVTLGAGRHTQVHHIIARHAPATRVFTGITSGTNATSEVINFSYLEGITRQIEFLERSIDTIQPDLLDRALLESVFDAYGFSTYAVPGSPYHLDSSIKVQVIDHMSDEQVQQLLTQMETIKLPVQTASEDERIAAEAQIDTLLLAAVHPQVAG